MNQRIRELAEQVYGSCATEQEEKFAELIVRECAGLFDRNETDVRIPEYRIHESIMYHFEIW